MKTEGQKQNITLALPKRLVRRAKVLAAERETSISAILRELLEEFLRREDDYARAMHDELARMSRGVDLGSKGSIAASRDALHER